MLRQELHVGIQSRKHHPQLRVAQNGVGTPFHIKKNVGMLLPYCCTPDPPKFLAMTPVGLFRYFQAR